MPLLRGHAGPRARDSRCANMMVRKFVHGPLAVCVRAVRGLAVRDGLVCAASRRRGSRAGGPRAHDRDARVRGVAGARAGALPGRARDLTHPAQRMLPGPADEHYLIT